MRKAPTGTIVYAKKHARAFRDREETPRIIVAHKKQRSGMIVAVLNTGERVSFDELTDVRCSEMQCGDCKWHKGRKE